LPFVFAFVFGINLYFCLLLLPCKGDGGKIDSSPSDDGENGDSSP
jgi:hypothetical protein